MTTSEFASAATSSRLTLRRETLRALNTDNAPTLPGRGASYGSWGSGSVTWSA